MWEVTGYSNGSNWKYVSPHSFCTDTNSNPNESAAAPIRKSRKLRHHMRLLKKHKN